MAMYHFGIIGVIYTYRLNQMPLVIPTKGVHGPGLTHEVDNFFIF